MNRLESEEQRYRLIAVVIAFFFTIFFVAVFAMVFPAIEAETGEIHVGDVLFDRSSGWFPATLQNFMWFMFFIGVAEVWVRMRRARSELVQLQIGLLPEGEDDMLRSKDLAPVFKRIQLQDRDQHHFAQRLIKRGILQFQGSRSVDQVNSLLNSSLELMQHEIDLKYNMLRYLIWLLPTLGFIGTVTAIPLALSAASHMPDITSSIEMRAWMGMITTKLALAFNTTLVALAQSSILVLLQHVAQSREERALNSSGQYCLDNLINKLYEE
jgi:biopolymer transport protein ExbB/TolQ